MRRLRHGGGRAPAAGAAVAASLAALVLSGCGGSAARPLSPAPPSRGAVSLSVGGAQRPIPRGFLGLSIEFQAVPAYTGTDPHAVNPVLLALVRNLSPGQPPVIRIGGDSTDVTWVPTPGVAPPRFSGYTYALTPDWLRTTAAFAHDLGARLTLGLNLAAGAPAIDAAEARAYLAAFGRRSIAALEIGNEPNLYRTIPEWKLANGQPVTARPRSWGPPQYRHELAATIAGLGAATPRWTLAGPALAAGETVAGIGRWLRAVPTLLRDEPSMRTLTIHRYPLKHCYPLKPGNPQDPTIAHLLAPYSTAGLAAGVAPWVRIARAQGRTLRIDELGSVACRGKAGVSDTFASALWATDVLFSLAQAGVGGVNLHTLPDSYYHPFTFARHGGRWSAHVEPEYYGLQLFAQAAPVGSRLVALRGARHTRSLSTWATRAPGGTVRVVLVDKDPHRGQTVRIAVPSGTHGRVTVERLSAPGPAARSRVSLGGRSYGARTTTGRLAAMRTTVARRYRGPVVSLRVGAASAALVTFPR